MKERPILFSGPMVRAILAGTKTQTRRIVTTTSCGKQIQPPPTRAHHVDEGTWEWWAADAVLPNMRIRCPYGVPGDRLWVREAFGREASAVLYRATDEELALDGMRWCPSIHMPRKLSRIELEIVSVRVERLQDITDDDIRAEGVTVELAREMSGMAEHEITTLRWAWAVGWDCINGKRAPWSSNPWVWRVEFRRLP